MERKLIRTFYDLKDRSQKRENGEGLSRRQLLLGLGSLGLFGVDILGENGDDPVVIVTLPGKVGDTNPHYFYLRVWEKVLRIVGDKKKLLPAAKAVLGKENKYSVKIDCRSPASLPSNFLITAFLEVLSNKGVQPWDIDLWDKREVEAVRAGYNLTLQNDIMKMKSAEAANFRGTKVEGNYKKNDVYRPSWLGGKQEFPIVNFLDKKRGNVAFTTPKYHNLCGIEGVLASTALGAVANSGALVSSSDNMIKGICELWQKLFLSKKLLSVVDTTAALYEGGPVGLPYYVHNARQIIVGHDPVAVDLAALEVIDKKRIELKYTPALEKGMKLLETAESMGLGKKATRVIRVNVLE